MSREIIEGEYAVSLDREALEIVMDGAVVHLTLGGRPVAALVPVDMAPLDGAVWGIGTMEGPLSQREALLDELAARFSPDETAAELAERIGGR